MTQKCFEFTDAKTEVEKLMAIWHQFSEEDVSRLNHRWAMDFLATQADVDDLIKTKKEFQAHLAKAMSIVAKNKKIDFLAT